jgi:hypothetical protein
MQNLSRQDTGGYVPILQKRPISEEMDIFNNKNN